MRKMLKSMIKATPVLIFAIFTLGCGSGPKTPDVSGISIDLSTKRFEKDFFSLDTNRFESGMESLRSQYPEFLNDFTMRILGLQQVDTAQWTPLLKQFLREYRPIYDSSKALESEVAAAEKEIKSGLQFVHHYFPNYPLPKSFITFIGPIDAFAYGETGGYGEILTPYGVCSGLQLHLGASSMIYKSDAGLQMYPEYISRRFTPAYISINCIKNIIDDVYPPMKQGGKLIEIMVDHGKRMYLLDLFMPEKEEELKFGYTADQLKGAQKNEGFIWNHFTENNLLFETDLLKIRSYVDDGPMTSEFGIGSPGFISLFIGKQIIRAYMDKHPETKIQDLLALDAQKILAGSSYKPR